MVLLRLRLESTRSWTHLFDFDLPTDILIMEGFPDGRIRMGARMASLSGQDSIFGYLIFDLPTKFLRVDAFSGGMGTFAVEMATM